VDVARWVGRRSVGWIMDAPRSRHGKLVSIELSGPLARSRIAPSAGQTTAGLGFIDPAAHPWIPLHASIAAEACGHHLHLDMSH
jgi:hypothetical protein